MFDVFWTAPTTIVVMTIVGAALAGSAGGIRGTATAWAEPARGDDVGYSPARREV
jgi:hypothetical protein